MDYKKEILLSFSDMDYIKKLRLESSKLFLEIFSFIFFFNIFLVWISFNDDIFQPILSYSYYIFLTSFNIYIYLYLDDKFKLKKSLKITIIIFLFLFFILFSLPFSWISKF